MTDQPRVVIVGGGFGGLYAAKAFRKQAVHVTLIDKQNYHLFLPLLYQVAIAGLSPADIATPLREIFNRDKNIRTIMGTVTDVDPERKLVYYNRGELPYDALIVATGAVYHYFGNDTWAYHAPGMDGLESALEIRRQILDAYEQAEQESDPVRQAALMTFVVVGAGPTGVELAGAIAEMARHTLTEDFRIANPNQTRVILVEMLDRVLPPFPVELSHKAQQSLAELGVTVRTNTKVLHIAEDHVVVESKDQEKETIHCAATMWAAGVKTSGLTKVLQERTGVQLDRAGRVHVAPDLSIPNYPDIFVVGDIVHFEKDGKVLPGLAPVAMQQGEHAAAACLCRFIHGQPSLAFHYQDRGMMATIGRASAVADLRLVKLSGLPAWLIWLFIHLMYLVGFRNRLIVFLQWTWNYFTFRRGVRLIVDRRVGARD
ncbi:NAD(P)-binding protein [bacterium]|nr:NAD(P)-binding protein [bacterium]